MGVPSLPTGGGGEGIALLKESDEVENDGPRGRGTRLASGEGEAPPPKMRGLKEGMVAKN